MNYVIFVFSLSFILLKISQPTQFSINYMVIALYWIRNICYKLKYKINIDLHILYLQYFYRIFMQELSSFVETYTSILQQCLLSKDPLLAINQLPASPEKRLLLFLLEPHSEDFKIVLQNQFKIRGALLNSLDKWKAHLKITSAKTPEQIQYLIGQFLNLNNHRYNYSKPAELHLVSSQGKVQQQSHLSSTLQPIKPLNEWTIQELERSEESIGSLTKKALRTLDQKRLLGLKTNSKQIFLQRGLLKQYPTKFAIQFIQSFYQEMIKLNRNYQITSDILSSLSKDQVLSLRDSIPNIVNKQNYLQVWFAHKYFEDINLFNKVDLTISEKDQKKRILTQVIKDLDSLKTNKAKTMRNQILKQLVVLNVSREDVDKDLFIEYVRENPSSSSFQNKQTKTKKIQAKKSKSSKSIQYQSDMFFDEMIDARRGQPVNSEYDKIIKQSIENIFKKPDAQKSLKELQQFFETSRLNNIYARIKLAEGGKFEDYEHYIPSNELSAFKEEKEISILDSNKKKWKVDQDVQLKIKIKNVKNIHVQVYKLDLQKHFRQNYSDIDQLQNLSYLQPNSSYNYQTEPNNPYLTQIYNIKVEGIQKQRGVWIIQFQGEGITSRAFIRKGSIVMLTKNSTIGTQMTFYDEQGTQIKGLSIWVQGKKHEIEDKFILPYGQASKNVQLTVIKDSYAEKFTANVPQQSYALMVDFIYNSESFIVGSIAKMILHPRLHLSFDSNMQVLIKLLQKVRILITFTNNLGIKSTIDFDNVQFKNNEDYVLQFPVQSYTRTIEISVTGKVKKYDKKQQQLSAQHQININLAEESTNFLDLYLKKGEQNYILYLLGKNGQRVPRTQVTVQILSQGRIMNETQNLITSKNGQIELGNLNEVQRLSAKVNLRTGIVARQWSINNSANQVDLLNNSIYKFGQQIALPYVKKQSCALWRVSQNGVYIQSHVDKISFGEQKVEIKSLPVGKYILEFYELDSLVEFSVIQGKTWQNKNKLYNQKTGILYELNASQNCHLSFGQAKIINDEGRQIIQVPILSTYDITKDSSFRAHVLASSFLIPNFNNKLDPSTFRNSRSANQRTFGSKISAFYNNKKLSDQASYVLNRKNEKKYVGNNLEKPKLFLKRIQVRDTSTVDQVLEAGNEYAALSSNNLKRAMAPQQMYSKSMARGLVHDRSYPLVNPLDLTTHNNFLAIPSAIVPNLKTNVIRFELPKGYSHFECLLISKSTGISKNFSVGSQQAQVKNLRHIGMKESTADKAWTMSRQIYKARKGENIAIGRDSVWSAVGISNIIGFAKIKGALLQDWVLSWNTYSEQQKLKIYDEKVCHELNTFIKFNDLDFFKKVVEPFIKNKITKTFVDYCLLDNNEALKWAHLYLYRFLNEFEKVLLIQQLVRVNRKQQAAIIVNSMENINKSNRISFERFKNQFDTVITAKLTQTVERKKQQAYADRISEMRSAPMMMDQCDMFYEKQCAMQCAYDDDDFCYGEQQKEQFAGRAQFTQPFKQMEKTKQYTQTTYSKIKYEYQSQTLVSPSPFWTSVAQHFISGNGQFVSENFMYLRTAVEFTLAACFIPNQKLLEFGLKNEGQSIVIQANSNFLVYVRQVKSLNFEKKFGVLLNQRFFNPDDRYYYEQDGTRIEKQTDQFVVRRPYCIQTLITNTSGTKLELQLLIDIPKGSIPLKSHQNTQILSINLQPYSTLSFERFFYFPEVGSYSLYPANACRGDSVIAKSQQIKEIKVLQNETIKKLDTLQNVLKSGQKDSILQYLQSKNIFDYKIFDSNNILWMLKDKEFFIKVIDVLRTRKYYQSQIWIFGYYHGDIGVISQYQMNENLQVFKSGLGKVPIYEYFPYYSSRTHKFLNENKSIIRNQQLKKTYLTFLFTSLFNDPQSAKSRIVFIYYLLLQDRIDQASSLIQLIDEESREQYRLQFDYIECFIDMYNGFPGFSKARKITEKYNNFSVKSWQSLFKQISDTLKQYDSEQFVQQKKKVQYSTTVFNEGSHIRINIPSETNVQVCYYDINLELYFSTFPFADMNNFISNILPNRVDKFNAGQSRQEKVIRDENMKDCFIQIFSSTSGLQKKKISSFLWSNPKIKIKLKEDRGYAQVFYEGRKQAGCYCKVYQKKNGQDKFYRDGYTDITGTFKYALADLEGVTQFCILFITDFGGIVSRVKPPSQQAYLS